MPTLNDLIAGRAKRAAALAEKYGPDYAETARTIEINKAEQAVIDEWRKSLDAELKIITRDEFAIGEVTYSFVATGLGYILVVKEAVTGKELNVTAALDWHFFG